MICIGTPNHRLIGEVVVVFHPEPDGAQASSEPLLHVACSLQQQGNAALGYVLLASRHKNFRAA